MEYGYSSGGKYCNGGAILLDERQSGRRIYKIAPDQQWVVTVHNLGTGSITYPGTINVEGGTVNMRQFSLDNSAQHINMRVSGGTLRLAGTIYSSHRVIPELDVQISSEAKAVEIVGWMNVDREFTLSDKSGGKFKSVGIVSAITQK